MPYIGKSTTIGVRQRYMYTATASQTTFSGTDTQNLTLNYTDSNFVDVYLNGVLLKTGTDYTATSGTSVVLASGAVADDIVEIIVYDTFAVANFYNRTDSDSRYVNIDGDTMTGDLTVQNATPTLKFTDTDNNYDATIQGLSGSLVLKADSGAEFGTETIQFNTGGSQNMTLDASGNLGIGPNMTTPSSTLAVETSSIASLSSYAGHIVIGPSSRSSSSGDYSGGILFDQANGIQASGKKGASILGFQDGSDVNSMGITFNVHGTDGTANRFEAMRIDSSGKVGIGENSPDTLLHISDSVSPTIRITNTDTSVASDQTLSEIQFEGSDSSTDADGIRAKITALYGGVGGFTSLQFFTAGENTETLSRILDLHSNRATFNEDSGNIDFRVESNNSANMIFVDASEGHVNINTGTDHGGLLNIESGDNTDTAVFACSDSDANTGPVVALKRTVTGADDDLLGRIRFDGRDDGGNNTTYARLDTQIKDASNGSESSKFTLKQLKGGSEITAIDSADAEFVINQDSADVDFRVETDNRTHAFFIDAGNDIINCFTSSEVSTGSNSGTGVTIKNNGRIVIQTDDAVDANDVPLRLGRLNHDSGETILLFSTNGDARGSITESSGTVSYNAFMGSHITQSVPSDILEGTVLESTGELIDSTDEDYKGYVEQKRLTKCKVSDTEDSNNVYGVFQVESKTGVQYTSSLGSFFVRIHSGETVSLGDLLSSKGDGTAKVQSDDVIRSRTIGKVTSLTKKTTYSDGSYLLPCVLYCG